MDTYEYLLIGTCGYTYFSILVALLVDTYELLTNTYGLIHMNFYLSILIYGYFSTFE